MARIGEGVPYGAVRALARLVLSIAIVLGACAGTGERACDLLEDVPGQFVRADSDEVREVADAARESEVEEIRTIGDELALNIARAPALETILAGGPAKLIQMNLDKLRRVCQNLADEG